MITELILVLIYASFLQAAIFYASNQVIVLGKPACGKGVIFLSKQIAELLPQQNVQQKTTTSFL